MDRPSVLGSPSRLHTLGKLPPGFPHGAGGHLARGRAAEPVQGPGVASGPAGPRARSPRQRPTRSPGDPRRERASAPPAPTRQDPHPPGRRRRQEKVPRRDGSIASRSVFLRVMGGEQDPNRLAETEGTRCLDRTAHWWNRRNSVDRAPRADVRTSDDVTTLACLCASAPGRQDVRCGQALQIGSHYVLSVAFGFSFLPP